jgi:hypothetical protein
MNSFWSPWKEDKSAMKLALIIGIFMVLLLFGFKTIFQNNPPEYATSISDCSFSRLFSE